MVLSVALFALFMTGFWLYCLTDAMLTPAPEYRGLTKPAWIAVIAVTFIGGALAWLIVRQPTRSSSGRRPAPVPRWDPLSAPKGPDDDAEFLHALDRAIHGNWQDGGEV